MCLLDLRLPLPAINHQVNEWAKCYCKNKFQFWSQPTAHTQNQFNSIPLTSLSFPPAQHDSFLNFDRNIRVRWFLFPWDWSSFVNTLMGSIYQYFSDVMGRLSYRQNICKTHFVVLLCNPLKCFHCTANVWLADSQRCDCLPKTPIRKSVNNKNICTSCGKVGEIYSRTRRWAIFLKKLRLTPW